MYGKDRVVADKSACRAVWWILEAMHGGVAEAIQGGRPMINDKAILVGVDGSHASYKATWWAANYAKHAGLTLQIVCAYSLPSYAAVSFDAT